MQWPGLPTSGRNPAVASARCLGSARTRLPRSGSRNGAVDEESIVVGLCCVALRFVGDGRLLQLLDGAERDDNHHCERVQHQYIGIDLDLVWVLGASDERPGHRCRADAIGGRRGRVEQHPGDRVHRPRTGVDLLRVGQGDQHPLGRRPLGSRAFLQPLLSDPGPDIVPGRRLVLRLPAADGWPVDRLRSRKYRSGHAVPDHRSARRARRLGMVGGWLSAEGSLSRVGVGLLGQRGRIVTEIRPGAERSWPRSQWGMLSG